MKKFLPVLVLTLLINFLLPQQVQSAVGEYRVVRITDGDTFLASDGVVHFKVRMIGIDAPESYQELGKIAKFKLGELIENQTVRLEPLQQSHGLDKYGRVLAKVFVNNSDIAEQLIRNGHAFYYRPYCTDYPDHKKSYQYDPISYVNAEEIARTKKLGVWSTSVELPCHARKKHKR